MGRAALPSLAGSASLGGKPTHLVERRESDVYKPFLDESPLVSVEEGEQQCADVSAIDVRICHQYDSMITQLRGRELLTLDPKPQARD